ncbi:SacI homology domain-containing protein [Peziza echinospora]|nr:SacI homology domain-containing protein [Peziza echinospora]
MDKDASRSSSRAAALQSVPVVSGGEGSISGDGGGIEIGGPSSESNGAPGREETSPPGSLSNSIHSTRDSQLQVDPRPLSTSLPTSISEKGSVSNYETESKQTADANSSGCLAEQVPGNKDEEPTAATRPLEASEKRGHSTGQQMHEDEIEEKEEAVRRMYKFTLYETTMRYYIVGSDLLDSRFRILKIDRTADVGDLSITEDEVEYTREEMRRLLATIEDGNLGNGGLREKCHFWGLLGFIRFTGAYYMLLITKRSTVGMIGGHYLYQIDKTELVPLTTISTNSKKSDQTPEEARFVHILGNLDLSTSFYFSYSYDITHTLQHNIARERQALQLGLAHPGKTEHNDMFAWNHYLLQPAILHIKNPFDWCLPIIHGYVDQATISVFGRVIYITIIARRSRHFAGARFLKRGANDLGYVANDVETEQIVSEMLTTSFHAPGKKLYSNPNYTSYVQHRGSIPLFWAQENNAATPKPPINLNLIDPFFSAAALHFDNMFQRYGAPVIVLNLVKNRERVPRESILLNEFTQAITYLNQFLAKEHRIQYIAWDMSRASKSRDQDVIETLEEIGEQVLQTTGFFHNGYHPEKPPSMQNGVCRTNCIDCLDRTNAAQFVVGKRALGHQLHALGVISDTSVEYDTDAVNLFTHMYHDHGDTIAVQYAGSHLVNTMETYRKINQWSSHSRDMLESFKRYYNNSFLDAQRQEAINLFLGNYIFARGQPMLWDLTTDYYLHHMDPRQGKRKRSYVKWWTPCNLEKRTLPDTSSALGQHAGRNYSFFDDYWTEYYRPKSVSTLEKLFAYNMNSTVRYIPIRAIQEGRYNLSPFKVRITYADSVREDPARTKRKKRKSVKIAMQIEEGQEGDEDAQEEVFNEKHGIGGTVYQHHRPAPPIPTSPRRKSAPAAMQIQHRTTYQNSLHHHQLLPLEDLITRLLHPSVSSSDAEEYSRYMSHPLNLPLVTSNTSDPVENHSSATPQQHYAEFVSYVNLPNKGGQDTLAVKEEDVKLYERFVSVSEERNVLGVEGEEVLGGWSGNGMWRKRYKAYQTWLNTGKLKNTASAVGDGDAGGGW